MSLTAYPGIASSRKSFGTFTVTRHLKENKSKATSTHFLVKMIAKTKKGRKVMHTKNQDQLRTPTNNGRYINNISTTTEPPPKNGQQLKLPGGGGGGPYIHFTGAESSP